MVTVSCSSGSTQLLCFLMFCVENVILKPAVVRSVVVTRRLQQGERRFVELLYGTPASSLQSSYTWSQEPCVPSFQGFYINDKIMILLHSVCLSPANHPTFQPLEVTVIVYNSLHTGTGYMSQVRRMDCSQAAATMIEGLFIFALYFCILCIL